MSDRSNFDRREMLVGLTAVTAGSLLGSSNAESANSTETRPANANRAPALPAATLGTLAAGTQLGQWKVVAVHRETCGGIPIILETEGQLFQVDVLRRDDAGPRAPGQSARYSVFVANQGNGQRSTVEVQGLGAMALAQEIARMEARGVALPELLSLEERLAKFPDGMARPV
jgi:hypothetical protein